MVTRGALMRMSMNRQLAGRCSSRARPRSSVRHGGEVTSLDWSAEA